MAASKRSQAFKNRVDAGEQLAETLALKQLNGPLVFATCKGGLILARAIATRLEAPLDMAPARELENRDLAEFTSVTADAMKTHKSFTFSPRDIHDRTLIIVDDVIANGAGALTAIRSLREKHGSNIIVAAAVISREAEAKLKSEGAEILSLQMVDVVESIAEFFADEFLVSDDEIRTISSDARHLRGQSLAHTDWVEFPLGDSLQIAKWTPFGIERGIVVLMNTDADEHESQSVIDEVATKLQMAGLGTLALTLNSGSLKAESEVDANEDVAVLAHRVRQVSNWLEEFSPAMNLPLSYFGVGIAGAAMIEAACATPERVKSIVCYESPLELVEDFWPRIHAPTLLVLKTENSEHLASSRLAADEIRIEKSLLLLSECNEGIGTLTEHWIHRFMTTGHISHNTRPVQNNSHETMREME